MSVAKLLARVGAAALILSAVPLGAQQLETIIETFAGGNEALALNYPGGVAVDGTGNIYIAELYNHRIRRVDATTNNVSTIAGTGSSGFSGDGGVATAARLRNPGGVAVDGSGNVYIADTGNHRIRRVDATTNNVSTIAGTGIGGFSGDDGAATSARLNHPIGIAVDASGNIYVAELGNHRVRRITSTGTISTIAGTGAGGFSGDGGAATSAQLWYPTGVAVDGAGNVYIADQGNARVRRVTSAGTISTIAGTDTGGFSGDGGAATTAELASPTGVAVDGAGNVYITDQSNDRVRRVTSAGIISTIAGTGTAGFSGDGGAATSAQLDHPVAVAVDGAGNVYIGDTGNQRVRRVTSTGTISTIAGVERFGGDGGPATSALFHYPEGVAVDGSGNVFIADVLNRRIRRVDAATNNVSTIAGTGTRGFSGDGGPATSAQLSPSGVAVDDAGHVYVVDWANDRIRRVDAATGTISTVAGTGTTGFSGDGGPATSAQLTSPGGVAVDGSGNVFIADTGNSVVRRVTPAGTISTIAGPGQEGFIGDGGPATSAHLGYPEDVAVDGSGNIYIADASNHRVRRVDANGTISTIAGTGTAGFAGDGGAATSAQLDEPQGVAVDGSGNVFIADWGNSRIRRVDAATGNISTVAGNGRTGFSGDGGAAIEAELETTGVAVDSAGNIYFADTLANRIRRTLSGQIQPNESMLSLVGEAAVAEGGVAQLSVRLTAARSSPTAFSWRVLADADPDTADADAGEHGDASGTGVIAAGELEAAIEVPIADDEDIEPAREWFIVELAVEGDDPVALGRVRAPVAVLEGVCDRTPAVAAALAPADACETATPTDLAAQSALSLDGSGLTALRTGDLAGLTGLSSLVLDDNALTALPPRLLSETPNLRFLRLHGNDLSMLPGDALAGLGALEELDLSDNALAALPDGLFEGVRSLRRLNLSGNPGAPFPLEVGLRRTDAPAWAAGPATVEVFLSLGAPFPLEARITTSGGAIEDVPVLLAAGESVGQALEISAGDGATQLTVFVGDVPDIICGDRPCWDGLTLAAGEPLALFFAQPPMAVDAVPTPAPLFGTELVLPFESLVIVGSQPVTRWEASSSNPAVAVAIRDGMLVVTPDLGAEGTAEIQLMATDAEGQTATARFTIEVEFHWPAGIVDGWRGIVSTTPATSTPE